MNTAVGILHLIGKAPTSVTHYRALENQAQVLRDRTHLILHPKSIDTTDIRSKFSKCEDVIVPDETLSTYYNASRFMVDPLLYQIAADLGFEFLADTHLDGWVNRDDLDWWTSLPFDFIGGPMFMQGSLETKDLSDSQNVSTLTCGGMSLRRVKPFLEFSKVVSKNNPVFLKQRLVLEDVVYSGGLIPEWERSKYPIIRACPSTLSSAYCWNIPTDSKEVRHRGMNNSIILRRLSGVSLPTMYHKADPRFASTHYLYDNVNRIVMFSSAVKPDVRLDTILQSGDLPVFMNHCHLLQQKNASTRIALGKVDRILTVHNDTTEYPFGYCGYGIREFIPEVLGFSGRHEQLCLHFRVSNKKDTYVTHGQKILSPSDTRVLQNMEFSGSGAPTCGYMTYNILRSRYPKTKIVLVDFYGNTCGRSVNFRHDPGYEQSVYEKDSLVERIFL